MSILEVKTFQDIANYPTPSDIDGVVVHGFYEFGDGGGGLYKRVASMPPGGMYAISATGGKFKLCNNLVDIRHFGASTALVDNSPYIQKMVDALGYFVLPVGTFNISNPILIRAAGFISIGSKWSGAGSERSILNCVGMTGVAAIKPDTTQNIRITMIDFRVQGDCDSCIDTGAGNPVYSSTFSRLALYSTGAAAFVCPSHFSTTWDNVQATSAHGHGFDLGGGVSNAMIGCYARNVGANKAGYRIKNAMTLIGCNGVNEVNNDCYWGWFGNISPASMAIMTLIGCNMEDWNLAAIKLDGNNGSIDFIGCQMYSRATGTYAAIIDITGVSNSVKFGEGTGFISKGSTLSGLAPIVMSGANYVLDEHSLGNAGFTTFYRTDATTIYNIPSRTIFYGDFPKTDVRYSRDSSFRLTNRASMPAGTTTYAVGSVNGVLTANTGATVLTNLTGGFDAQEMLILVKDAFTTLKHLAGGSGQLKNASGADIVASNGDVYKYVLNGTTWAQI